jgi:hypothetical protein
MGTTQRDGVRIQIRHLVLVIIAWWVLMAIAYFITTFRIDQFKSSLQDSGIKIVQEISNQVREPLLERDAQAIHTLLVDVAKRVNVVYASVTDHQNEIIGFLGGEQARPATDEAIRKIDNIMFWEGGIANHNKIFSFASEVTYSGTKIGEIYVVLPAAGAELIRNQFRNIAIYSLIILLFFIFFVRFRSIVTFPLKLKKYFQRSSQTKTKSEPSLFDCPMCGAQGRLNSVVFHSSQPERMVAKKASKLVSKAGWPVNSKDIDLTELANREDLLGIRRQVILRCAEIIQKLTA